MSSHPSFAGAVGGEAVTTAERFGGWDETAVGGGVEDARRTAHAGFGGFQVVKIVIHGKGQGTCSFSGKENVEGLLVSFEDGTLAHAFVSNGSFLKFVRMKAPLMPQPQPAAATSNGEAPDA